MIAHIKYYILQVLTLKESHIQGKLFQQNSKSAKQFLNCQMLFESQQVKHALLILTGTISLIQQVSFFFQF